MATAAADSSPAAAQLRIQAEKCLRAATRGEGPNVAWTSSSLKVGETGQSQEGLLRRRIPRGLPLRNGPVRALSQKGGDDRSFTPRVSNL